MGIQLQSSTTMSKTVLVITSSPMGDNSASNKVTNAFIEQYKQSNPQDTLKIIDLSTTDVPPFNAERVQAKFATWAGNDAPENAAAAWEYTKELIDQFTSADKYVIASPMWNFGISNQLKRYLDHIVQPWKTFDPTKTPGGLVTGKPALIVAASGSALLGTQKDFVCSYLRAILAFIGFTDIREVTVAGTATPNAGDLVSSAIEKVKGIASSFEFDGSATPASFSPNKLENTARAPLGKRVLAVVSSPMCDYSASIKVMQGFLEEYKRKVPDADVKILDIFKKDLAPFSATRVQAKFASYAGKDAPEGAVEDWEYTKELIEEFKQADAYVFAVPTWNLAIPNQLKLYLDHIVQPYKTFHPAEGGMITGKPVFLLCAAGGPTLGSPYDFVTPYLECVLGFIGFTDIQHVWVNSSNSEGAVDQGIKDATALLQF